MNIRAAIIGPTSYTGLVLIEWLLRHPSVQITYLASQRAELPNIADDHPRLRGRCELQCQPIDAAAIAKAADVVFTCLPHVVAMEYVPALMEEDLKVIDLSADYRLADADLYERVYGHVHSDAANLPNAAYGLPELFAADIADAQLVANPGCYPTAATLGIAPLLQRSLVQPQGIVINAASGATGAGRSPKPNLHFPEVNEGYTAYAPGVHRHQPEIEQTLTRVKGSRVSALFVPHLLPINQGIFETIYLDPKDDDVTQDELFDAFDDAYSDQPFVRVRRDLPNVKFVVNTNYCDLSVRLVDSGSVSLDGDEPGSKKVVVLAAEDNMIKGASGQAIQNMNLMFGQEMTAGLQ